MRCLFKMLVYSILLYFLTVSMVHAKMTREDMAPVYSSQTLQAFSVYMVGSATTTIVSYQRFGSSICFTTSAGLYPGTTAVIYADTNADTIGELIDRINGIPSTTAGADGGIIATRIQGAYMGNRSADIQGNGSWVSIKGSTSAAIVPVQSTVGMTYILDKELLNSDQHFCITDISVNTTFGSGSAYFDVYDSSLTTRPRIRHEEIELSGVAATIDIPSSGYLIGQENKEMRFDLYADTNTTLGFINFTGFKK